MGKMIGLLAVAGMCAVGCGHTPTKPGERADLRRDAQKTVQRMEAQDPTLRPVLDQAVGYIVFPSVGSGGLFVGGGAGSGVVFEGGRQTGFAQLTHMEVGALAGGQRYSEIVVVHDPKAMQDLKAGRYDFGAGASAIAVRSGAAASGSFGESVSVFVEPIRGAMVNASISGQRIRLVM